MTPAQRRRCLEILGWDQRQYARRLGWDEATVRRWMRDGGEAPAALDTWLRGLVDLVQKHGPPPDKRGEQRDALQR